MRTVSVTSVVLALFCFTACQKSVEQTENKNGAVKGEMANATAAKIKPPKADRSIVTLSNPAFAVVPQVSTTLLPLAAYNLRMICDFECPAKYWDKVANVPFMVSETNTRLLLNASWILKLGPYTSGGPYVLSGNPYWWPGNPNQPAGYMDPAVIFSNLIFGKGKVTGRVSMLLDFDGDPLISWATGEYSLYLGHSTRNNVYWSTQNLDFFKMSNTAEAVRVIFP